MTWVDDPCCLGDEDGKRVTVVVTVAGSSRSTLLSTILTDPDVNG